MNIENDRLETSFCQNVIWNIKIVTYALYFCLKVTVVGNVTLHIGAHYI